MRLLTGIIFSTFFTFAATAETFIWKNDVRGWLIGVDPTLGFWCFMLKKYEDSTAIRVHFNPDGRTFEFYIAHPDWRSIENNKKYPMSVQFGNRVPWDGEGHGVWIGELPSIRLALSRVNAEVLLKSLCSFQGSKFTTVSGWWQTYRYMVRMLQ